MEHSEKRFYDIAELIKIIPLSRSGLYAAVKKGLIPCQRIGHRILIPCDFVDNLVSQSKTI